MNTPRVALVTGATSGIGATIAKTLASDGLRVLVTGRSHERGRQVSAEIGNNAHFVSCDLLEPGAAGWLVDSTVSEFGRIDVLVNNAAVDHTNSLLEVTSDEIETTFETNTFSPMKLLIAAAIAMKAQGDGGSIINITSRLASIGVPSMGVYSASKGAMLAFTTASAVELAPFNIRVNAIAPGMTRTPLYEDWISGLDKPEEMESTVASAIPLGRIAEPDDVASIVSFLASQSASYITGVSIPVDGGYLAQ
ncbi:SDR family oxidoreductase [Pontimonas sp.]|nr:SDR family oxidoreductase [Pontimonas sp.]